MEFYKILNMKSKTRKVTWKNNSVKMPHPFIGSYVLYGVDRLLLGFEKKKTSMWSQDNIDRVILKT